MNRPVHYCKSWFRARKRPTEPWTDEQAAAAHLHRQPYTALVGSAERPDCFIDVADNVIGVGFLDSLLREWLTYAFQEVEAGKLFLTMAVEREFAGDTDKVARGVTYTFEQDGTVRIRRESFDPHRVETATSSFDPAPNVETRPRFGNYEQLVRVER